MTKKFKVPAHVNGFPVRKRSGDEYHISTPLGSWIIMPNKVMLLNRDFKIGCRVYGAGSPLPSRKTLSGAFAIVRRDMYKIHEAASTFVRRFGGIEEDVDV